MGVDHWLLTVGFGHNVIKWMILRSIYNRDFLIQVDESSDQLLASG